MKFKYWIQAARLRTLPLSLSGIIVGYGLAEPCKDVDFILDCYEQPCYAVFILCLFTTVSFQILSNFANDYGDGVKGTDANRKGEKRLVASGDLSPTLMKRAIIMMVFVSLLLSFYTLYIAFGTSYFVYFSVFITLGVLSIIAAIKYTVGKNAYGYSGFGDLFVFLFFGLLSTVGSYFLYTKDLSWDIFLPAITIGLFSVAVLNLNNMRDFEEDKKNHKKTLVVKIGSKNAKIYHYSLIVVGIFCIVTYSILNDYKTINYLFLLAFVPLLQHLHSIYHTNHFSEFDGELKKVALSTFIFAILFSIFI